MTSLDRMFLEESRRRIIALQPYQDEADARRAARTLDYINRRLEGRKAKW